VTVLVQNPEKKLFPGMTAYVSIKLMEKKDVLRVPASALRFTPPPEEVSGITRLFRMDAARRNWRASINDGQAVYILKDNKPQKVEVTLGATDDTLVEIKGDGIKEGDMVITGLMPRIAD
jgi:HlyD family secretion protein